MNKRVCAALVAVVVLSAGCASEPAAVPALSTAPTTTTTKAVPTKAELDQRAKAAIAPPDAFALFEGEVASNTPVSDAEPGKEGETLVFFCNGSLRPDGLSVGRTRGWKGGVTLFQHVSATAQRQGTTLLNNLSQRVAPCLWDRSSEEVQQNIPISKPEGVDGLYAFCEKNIKPDLTT